MQRPRPAETEHRGRGEGGVAGRACAGRTDGCTGSGGGVQPGHLPPRPPGARQWAQCRAAAPAGDQEPLGMEVGTAKRAPVEEGCAMGRISGYAGAQMGRGSQGSCIVGRAQREDGRGSGWSARSPASSWQRLELRVAKERCVGSRDRTKKARIGRWEEVRSGRGS